jgi:hypothetical protein
MGHEHIRVSRLAVFDGFFGMADGLGQMILRQCETRRQKESDSKAESESEISTVHVNALSIAIPHVGGNGWR